MSLGNYFVDETEQPLIMKRAGFDGFFVDGNNRDKILKFGQIAKKENMMFQSVHAPFNKIGHIWHEGEEGDNVVKTLIDCADATAEAGAPIMVSHVYIGFDTGETPNELGLDRLAKVVDFARSRGIKIAFENTEGEEFLAAVMDRFKGDETVGFCWDSGHEQCYNHSKDMLALYGDRLIATHLNDNLGISDFGGHIFWTDDLHLLPFDGIIDWDDAAARLNRAGFDGPLTFELNVLDKPGHRDNSKYREMSPEQYITEAHNRACRVAFKKLRNGNQI